jgi:LmbE family N-acetylglucosaminyl deacetylase
LAIEMGLDRICGQPSRRRRQGVMKGHMAKKIERALVVTAHPDDSEFGAAGTIAKLVRDGCEVTYVIVTNGNKGSSDRTMTPDRLARIREEEQRNAARTLGVERVQFLGYEDGEVEDTRDLRRDVSREIRRWRPDLVICQNPSRTYNLGASHRDHRVVGGVALDCVYPLARDHMAFPELMPEYEPHKVREVYVMQWESPRLVVDISDVFDLKIKALACHASQFADFAAVEARVRERSSQLGQSKRFAYAEAFDHIVI